MNDAPPDVLDLGDVLRSLYRGRRWIGAAFVLAAAATAAVVTSMPARYQSTVELRLTVAREPTLVEHGLELGAGEVISLLLSAETRQTAAAAATSPAVADAFDWTADQVTAVGSGLDTVFVLVRDADPDLAAVTADAVEAAARQVREARLRRGLQESLAPLEREHADLLARIAELETRGERPPAAGPLDETLDRLRLESAMARVIALEDRMARLHGLAADPPRDWRVVEQASPAQHVLQERYAPQAIVAVLVPTLLAAIVWLIHDGRPRRS